MRRFVAALMLAGGLLVAGLANGASLGNVVVTMGPTYTPSTLTGNVGDTFTIENQRGNGMTINVPANLSPNGAAVSLGNTGDLTTFTLVSVGTATIAGGTGLVVTINAAPASIPSLSEWTQLLLALMVMTALGWYFHKREEL